MSDQDGLSPKEKAKDLIEKIHKYTNCLQNCKQIAILMCTESINYEFYGSHTQEYWKKVKAELEKVS